MKVVIISGESFNKAAWNPADRPGKPFVLELSEDDISAILALQGKLTGIFSAEIKTVQIVERK